MDPIPPPIHTIVPNATPCRPFHPQKSEAHGDVRNPDGTINIKSAETWASVNAETGRVCVNALDWSFLIGTVSDYFSAFLEENSTLAQVCRKFLDSVSLGLIGKRDEEMFSRIYSMGVDAHLSEEEQKNPSLAVRGGKIPFMDDYTENLKQEEFGETLIPKLWRQATTCAKVKPFIYPIISFLSEGYRDLFVSIFDFPARMMWRARFFGSSLQPDAASKLYELGKYGIGSIFSGGQKKKLENTIESLNTTAKNYFSERNKKYNENHSLENNSGLGLTWKMWRHRLKDHWRGIRNPNEVLKEKIKDGVFKEEEVLLEDENSTDKPNAYFDKFRQKMSSITDLTAPFCAGVGIVGSVIDPFYRLMKVAGIEKGQKLLAFSSMVRVGASNINYLTRFIFPEYYKGEKKFKELKELVESGKATDATKLFYNAQRNRRMNQVWGMAMVAGTVVEPFLHLSKEKFLESRFLNFSFKLFQRFNNIGFFRFFSMRRQNMGIQRLLTSRITQTLPNSSLTATRLASVDELQKFDRPIEDIQAIANKRLESIPRNGILDPIMVKVHEVMDKAKNMLYGAKSIITNSKIAA